MLLVRGSIYPPRAPPNWRRAAYRETHARDHGAVAVGVGVGGVGDLSFASSSSSLSLCPLSGAFCLGLPNATSVIPSPRRTTPSPGVTL